MKIKNIGLGAGLLLGGGFTYFGGFLMSLHSPSDDTGIMLVGGAVFLIPGIIILGTTLLGWNGAKLIRSLGDKTKSNSSDDKKNIYIKIGIVLFVGWLAWPFISGAAGMVFFTVMYLVMEP